MPHRIAGEALFQLVHMTALQRRIRPPNDVDIDRCIYCGGLLDSTPDKQLVGLSLAAGPVLPPLLRPRGTNRS